MPVSSTVIGPPEGCCFDLSLRVRSPLIAGPFQDFYQAALAKGIKPTMARLTLARKIAAITLTLWKKGENFDAEKLKSQAA